MLHALAGRLAEDCEIKIINKEDGTVETVVNNTLYIWDGFKGHDDIPIKIEAWNEMAKEMSKYKKGDTIEVIGRVLCVMRKTKDSDKEFPTLAYRIIKIDENRIAFKEFNRLIDEYVNPKALKK